MLWARKYRENFNTWLFFILFRFSIYVHSVTYTYMSNIHSIYTSIHVCASASSYHSVSSYKRSYIQCTGCNVQCATTPVLWKEFPCWHIVRDEICVCIHKTVLNRHVIPARFDSFLGIFGSQCFARNTTLIRVHMCQFYSRDFKKKNRRIYIRYIMSEVSTIFVVSIKFTFTRILLHVHAKLL